MAKYSPRSLDTIFSALGDATRRGMLERLSRGEATVTELSAPSGLSLPTIQKHLRVLERSGFITHEKRGRVRHVRLARARSGRCRKGQPNLPPMLAARDWFAQFEARWDEHLQRLKQLVESDL